VRVVDLDTTATHDYPAPAGTLGWVSTAGQGSRHAFSPDGRYLAIRAATTPATPAMSELFTIQLTNGAPSLLAGAAASSYARVAWLPDSRWVATQTDDGTISAFDMHAGQTRSFPAKCCAVALLTTRR
jgi:hypothetical protein